MDETGNGKMAELSLLVSLAADAAGRLHVRIGALEAAAAAPESTLFFERYYATTPRDQRLVCELPRSEAELADLGRAVVAALQMHPARRRTEEPGEQAAGPDAEVFAA
jgi:hypothetical protein